ncbi:MAG: aminotransferase class V-fold PLP-dependent enzyme [Saprospiraceae bacterium]|nr:aminotransferase class V-fold PLP-dependent enzyme [Saprospiraceae bacterium]
MLLCQKHLFSIPEGVSYLNCSYMSPLSRPVEQAGINGLLRKARPWEITIPDFFEPVEKLKKLFASLVNVPDAQRIALVPSVSYGIASAAKNLVVHRGQNIVVVDEIFPSNYYSWQRLAEENGATLKVVKRPVDIEGRGRLWNQLVLESIDKQTAVVALPHAHWTDGTLFDLKAVRNRTNDVGAALIIDGTQSVGALPFDVAEIQPDALVCAGYKWLMGAYGLGLAYFGERFDNGTPIEENWINRFGSENFENLTNFQPSYNPAANRYCMGENSQFIAVPMLSKALELLLEWGVPNIQDYVRQIAAPYLQEMLDLGFGIEEREWRGSHLVGVRLPQGLDLLTVKKATSSSGVHVSYRGGAMRISPHLYNDSTDFMRLMAAINSVCS